MTYPHDDDRCRQDSVDAECFRDAAREFARLATALGFSQIAPPMADVVDRALERIGEDGQTTPGDETPEPRCYGHVFDPAHQGGAHMTGDPTNGWPAHTWSAGPSGRRQHCPDAVVAGDRYVCVKGGIMHARCVDRLDASVVER